MEDVYSYTVLFKLLYTIQVIANAIECRQSIWIYNNYCLNS